VQVSRQAEAVGVAAIVWSASAAFITFKIADLAVGLRVAEEAEREGLRANQHNERAYYN
jgi:Amt family ammonium transporter